MQVPKSSSGQFEIGRSLGMPGGDPSQEHSVALRLSPGRRRSLEDDEGESLAGFRSPAGTPGRSDFGSPLSATTTTPFAAYVRTPVRALSPGHSDCAAGNPAQARYTIAPAGNSSNTSVSRDKKEKSPQKKNEGGRPKIRRHSSPNRKSGMSPPPGKLPASPLATLGDRSLLSPNSAHRLREKQKALESALDQTSDSSDFSQDSQENSPIGKLVRTTRGVFKPGMGLLFESPAKEMDKETRRHTAPANPRHIRAETGLGSDAPNVIFSECAGLIRALSFVPRLQVQSVAIAINEFVHVLVDAQPERTQVATKYKALKLILEATSATNNVGVNFFLAQMAGAIQCMPDFRNCSEFELELVSDSRADLAKRALEFGKQAMEQSRRS